MDIEEIVPLSLGDPTSIHHIVFLHSPAEGNSPEKQDTVHELSFILYRVSDDFLNGVEEIEGVSQTRVESRNNLPVLKLSAILPTSVYGRMESLCRRHQILIPDIVKGVRTQPSFDTPAKLAHIPKSRAMLEIMKHFLGGYKSAIVQDEVKGNSHRLFLELSSFVQQANCYQLSVGHLHETADIVCRLVNK